MNKGENFTVYFTTTNSDRDFRGDFIPSLTQISLQNFDNCI